MASVQISGLDPVKTAVSSHPQPDERGVHHLVVVDGDHRLTWVGTLGELRLLVRHLEEECDRIGGENREGCCRSSIAQV